MVKVSPVVFTFFVFLVTGFAQVSASESQHAHGAQTYLGFDRNDYPGDANLAALRKTFAFSGYWLNNPRGSTPTAGGERGCCWSAKASDSFFYITAALMPS
jgi:hypothetical protein